MMSLERVDPVLENIGFLVMDVQREVERARLDIANLNAYTQAVEAERVLRAAVKVARARRRALRRGLR